jgi:hypothetical protein
MHHLDKHSLLALSHCSRFTLASASADFAWSCLSVIRCRFTPSSLDLGPKLCRGLSNYVNVYVTWTLDHNEDKLHVSAEEAEALLDIRRLIGLDCTSRWSGGSRVLNERILAGLRGSLIELRMGGEREGCNYERINSLEHVAHVFLV